MLDNKIGNISIWCIVFTVTYVRFTIGCYLVVFCCLCLALTMGLHFANHDTLLFLFSSNKCANYPKYT